MREMRRLFLLGLPIMGGCTQTGSLDLELNLPTVAELRPAGMTTVEVLATSPEMAPISNRSVIDGNHFSAGDLPVGDNVQINVLLHDVSNRLVGLGEAPQLVNIVGDKTTSLAIPVRRPFIYAASGSSLYTFDPTLDPRDMKFQGQLAGLQSPQIAISVGGDRLVVGDQSQLQIIDTATHKVTGNPITLAAGTMIHDIAPIPGKNAVAVAHSGGLAIVSLDPGESAVQNADVGSVDRVAVGVGTDGHLVAYGLIGRVAPKDSSLVGCTGTSSLVAVSVDAPMTVAPTALPVAISGIAASTTQPAVFAALPCTGEVDKVTGSPATLAKVSALPNAAALTVLGDRVIAAGTRPSTPVCGNASGVTACTTATAQTCPETGTTRLAFVTDGARLVIQAIPIDGSAVTELELPERRETMVDAGDAARQHAQVLHPLSTVPLDIVALPGGQYVSVVTKNDFYIESTNDGVQYILPCLKSTTSDWLLIDLASASVAQRVRTKCDLTYRMNAYFNMWACDDPPPAERSTQGDYTPVSVGALFGVR